MKKRLYWIEFLIVLVIFVSFTTLFIWDSLHTKQNEIQTKSETSEDIILQDMKVISKEAKPLVKVVQYNVTLQKENETITTSFSKENYNMLHEGTLVDIKINTNGRAEIIKFPTLQK